MRSTKMPIQLLLKGAVRRTKREICACQKEPPAGLKELKYLLEKVRSCGAKEDSVRVKWDLGVGKRAAELPPWRGNLSCDS